MTIFVHAIHRSLRRQVSMNLVIWPFRAIWQLLTTILALTGRLAAIVVGLVLVVVGLVLTITVVGSVVGIPLIILGLMLMFRGIF
jgi:hypothetical protein